MGRTEAAVRLITPIELRATAMVDELSRRGSAEGAIFSTTFPGLAWTAGLHYGEDRVRTATDGEVTGSREFVRAGGWLGGELHGPVADWFVSGLLRADHLGTPDGSAGWAAGPLLRLARPPRPERVVGADPLLEWESRAGDVVYSRLRVRAGTDVRGPDLRAAAFVDVHGAGRGTPADAMPATDAALAPWLPAGALRTPTVVAAALDLAAPFAFDAFVRLRGRVLGAGDSRTLRAATWLPGAELGLIWPTVLGPISVGAAIGAGIHGDAAAPARDGTVWRLNAGIGTAF
jgi:hypothetical protein